jgi:hypothetical protein
MFVGGLLGILFVTFLRRVMVTDPELVSRNRWPRPRSTRPARKAARAPSSSSKPWGSGPSSTPWALSSSSPPARTSSSGWARSGRASSAWAPKRKPPRSRGRHRRRFGPGHLSGLYRGRLHHRAPAGFAQLRGRSPGLGALRPLLMYFLGPQLIENSTDRAWPWPSVAWPDMMLDVWKFIIRPIAVGGMLVGAGYTLFRMRKNLAAGIKTIDRRYQEGRRAGRGLLPLEKDLNIKLVLGGPRGDLRADDLRLQGLRRQLAAGRPGGRRHGRRRLFLRRRFGQPGRDDRLLEQPDLRPDLVDPDHRRPAHGRRRRRRG